MALDDFKYTVIGMTVGEVNLDTKTVRVRIPQYHGLPNNTSNKSYYVEDKDLPYAVIICPLGMALYQLKDMLRERTVVYIQFSGGELGCPIIVGWAGGNRVDGTINTVYEGNTELRLYKTEKGKPIVSPYDGGIFHTLKGYEGDDTPNGFILPFDGCVLNWGFRPYDPWNTGSWIRHGGIDLGGKPGGTPIYSITNSTVSFIYINDSSMGNSVWVSAVDTENNPIQIQYMHMDRIASGLSVGDTLHQGDMVGTLGTTGNSTGVHLHLGTRYTNRWEYRDPARVLGVTEWYSPYEWYSQQPGA